MKCRIRCIVYDMDGLLLATEQIYTDAMRAVVNRYGRDFDWAFKAQVIGRPEMESARHTVTQLKLPITAEAYLEQRNEILRQRFPMAQAKPGARELVEHFHRCGIAQAVATSSGREFFALKISRHRDWFSLFQHVVSAQDPEVERGKPAPDVFLVAAGKLGVAPAECLAFEDSPAGVAAAAAAGMPVVAVPEPQIDRALFSAADLVIASLEAFDPLPWALPAR